MIKLTIMLIAAPLFLLSIAANIFVKLTMRPKQDSDFDDWHYEFEDSHPAYAKYAKWSKITYIAAATAALLLFISIAF